MQTETLPAVQWKIEAVRLASETNKSWRKIAKELGVARSTLSDHLRPLKKAGLLSKDLSPDPEKPASRQAVIRADNGSTTTMGEWIQQQVQQTKVNKLVARKKDAGDEDNSRILCISDMHIPYHHPDTLEFLQYLKDKYNPTRIICMGDECDAHSLSYHDSDPDLPSASGELQRALPAIKQVKEMFPKMDILDSNHGSMVWRKAKTHGIPKHYIKSYNQVLEVDEGWKWSFDLTIVLPNGNKCYFHHGKSTDVTKLSQIMGMCAVQGHYHEKFKIEYWGNPNGLFWGLQTGCLIHDESLAFSYNNVNIKRPVIGTAVIIDSQPILEPMVLSEIDGRWVGRKQ